MSYLGASKMSKMCAFLSNYYGHSLRLEGSQRQNKKKNIERVQLQCTTMVFWQKGAERVCGDTTFIIFLVKQSQSFRRPSLAIVCDFDLDPLLSTSFLGTEASIITKHDSTLYNLRPCCWAWHMPSYKFKVIVAYEGTLVVGKFSVFHIWS